MIESPLDQLDSRAMFFGGKKAAAVSEPPVRGGASENREKRLSELPI